MANFKIFQDTPAQAKVQIFGSDTNTALNTDTSGNLGITSTGLSITPPSGGLAITPPSDGLSITSTGLAITPPSGGLSITPPSGGLAITPPSNGLSITSTGLAITPPSGGLSITPPSDGLSITSTGLAITPPSGGLSITPPSGGLAITPPSDGLAITSTGLAITPPSGGLSITPPTNGLLVTGSIATAVGTTEVITAVNNISSTAGGPAAQENVTLAEQYTYTVVNNSSVANAQVVAKLEISPDATNWITESGPTTINQASLETFVSSIFLKYARIYYNAVNAASAVTLAIYYQGQT